MVGRGPSQRACLNPFGSGCCFQIMCRNDRSESKERENQPAFNANSDIESSGKWGSCFHEHPPVRSAIIAGNHKGFVSRPWRVKMPPPRRSLAKQAIWSDDRTGMHWHCGRVWWWLGGGHWKCRQMRLCTSTSKCGGAWSWWKSRWT